MQTFDVSANILNDRLTFSSINTPRPKKMQTAVIQSVEEHVHTESVPVVRSLTQCARSKLNETLVLVVLQLVSGVILFGVLVQRQRLDAKLVCGAALLAIPLAAMYVSAIAPSLALLALLLLHDALVIFALAV